MSFNVRVLAPAQRDLHDIHSYAQSDDLDAVLQRIARLERFPKLGAQPKDARLKMKGYRFLVVEKHIVFYKISAQTVLIYRVLHQRRDYDKLL